MATMDKVLHEDQELRSFYESFEKFQEMLLGEGELINTDLIHIENVLEFMRAGTNAKRKKNFKSYFVNEDLDKVREFKKLILIIKNTVESGESEKFIKVRNELITQGILLFTGNYLKAFRNKETSVKQVNQQVEDDINNNKQQKYQEWIEQQGNELISEMTESFQNSSLNQELIKKFVSEFKKFTNGRLLLKIIEKGHRQIIGVPIQLTESGYKILPHPFLKSEWELSRPIDTLSNNSKIKVGDIISANFTAVRNENFYASLLFVDFDGAEIIPQTMQQALVEFADSDFIEKAYNVFELKSEEDEKLKAIITKKLLDTSKEVKDLLLEDLKQLDDIKAGIAKKNKELLEEEEKLDETRKVWYQILKRIDEKLILDGKYETIDEKTEIIEYDPRNFIKNLQSLFYFNDGEQLIYEEGIIKSFVYALQADILTILAGPSGTGKSSIVQAFARAVENVEIRMIPVQSSWTDAQDLLGYFHPTDKAFIPTPFMEAMAEAAKEGNKSKLFLICLDEMNLAHIEYYFSEILSAREEKTRTLRLYSKRYWDIAKIILRENTESTERQQSAMELIELYPHVFKIPDNVRFIGTLNMDHTVKPLSPKVIDRSFIIEINHLKSTEREKIKQVIYPLNGKVDMDLDIFKGSYLANESINEGVRKVQEISLLFEEYPNASLNSRGLKHIRNFLSYVKDEKEMNSLIDYIILGKILPRIEVKKTELDGSSGDILQRLMSYPLSYERFSEMLNTKHTVKFW